MNTKRLLWIATIFVSVLCILGIVAGLRTANMSDLEPVGDNAYVVNKIVKHNDKIVRNIASYKTSEVVVPETNDYEVVEVVSFETIETEAEEPEPITQSEIYLGNYQITAYCPCAMCCGEEDGITATGTVATAGRTIAVDPRVIPYQSRVIINGHEYIAEDCGGGITENKIDIFFDSHHEALEFGVQYLDVYLEVPNNE